MSNIRHSRSRKVIAKVLIANGNFWKCYRQAVFNKFLLFGRDTENKIISSEKKLFIYHIFVKNNAFDRSELVHVIFRKIISFSVVTKVVFFESILIFCNRQSWLFKKYSLMKYSPKSFFQKVFKKKYSNGRNCEKSIRLVLFAFLKMYSKLGIRMVYFVKCIR